MFWSHERAITIIKILKEYEKRFWCTCSLCKNSEHFELKDIIIQQKKAHRVLW